MTSLVRMRTLVALAVAGTFGVGAPAMAQYQNATPPTTRPAAAPPVSPAPSNPTDMKLIPPSRSETADSAFRKLDPAGNGFVTRDQAKQMEGFDQAFQQNDANGDGRLSADEFQNA